METMGKQRRPRRSFSKEFKAEVVELVRQPGNTAGSVWVPRTPSAQLM
ncbi:MAG: hypothetical protein M0Z69_16030 [Actinomycetota bacterium]|nr:hypothetical protein [Actinomycetota bacterium]